MAHFSINLCSLNHVRTIKEGCRLFGMDPQMRGFMTKPGITLFGSVTLWFPNLQNDYWNNCPKPSGTFEFIYESPKNTMKNKEQIKKYLGKGEIRVTFLKDETTFHDSSYHFVGIYQLDEEETLNSGKTDETRICIWKRVCTECDTDLKELEKIVKNIINK